MNETCHLCKNHALPCHIHDTEYCKCTKPLHHACGDVISQLEEHKKEDHDSDTESSDSIWTPFNRTFKTRNNIQNLKATDVEKLMIDEIYTLSAQVALLKTKIDALTNLIKFNI